MACYHPLKGIRGEVNANGRRPLLFSAQMVDRSSSLPVLIPCGQCVGCRLERSRQWAMRCMDEAQMHKENSFITLTYDNAHLPEDGQLIKRDLQLFFKRLRKDVKKKSGIMPVVSMARGLVDRIFMRVYLVLVFLIESFLKLQVLVFRFTGVQLLKSRGLLVMLVWLISVLRLPRMWRGIA